MDFPGTLFNHRCWMLTNLYHIWLVVWNHEILWLSIHLGMECHHPKWVRLTQGSCKGFGSYTGWCFGTFFIFHNIWDVIRQPLTNSIIFQDGHIAPPTSLHLVRWLSHRFLWFSIRSCIGFSWRFPQNFRQVHLIGTPLTHQRFLHRHQGAMRFSIPTGGWGLVVVLSLPRKIWTLPDLHNKWKISCWW